MGGLDQCDDGCAAAAAVGRGQVETRVDVAFHGECLKVSANVRMR